jgi:hypothetical protein
MQTTFVTYLRFSERSARLLQLAQTLESKEKTVQVIHASISGSERLQKSIGRNVLCSYDAAFTPFEAKAVILVDGDLLDLRLASYLMQTGKELFVLIPQAAMARTDMRSKFETLIENSEITPELSGDERLPRTFACRHFARTCRSCESMVNQFLADRRDKAANLIA